MLFTEVGSGRFSLVLIDLIINITSPVLFVLGVVRYSAFVSKDYFRFFLSR